MENEFILTSKEFATLLGISTESLRSRRRRGQYSDLYILKNKNYLWKRPAPKHRSDDRFSRGPSVLDESRLSAQASNTNSFSHLSLAKSKRNKNSGRHKHGSRTYYPNKAFDSGATSIVIGRSITQGNIKKNIQKLIKLLK